MSLRQLVEADCGGANPLVQLGGHFVNDNAHKEEGFSGNRGSYHPQFATQEDQLVNEFIGQISGPPQTFQMNALLQEMREIETQYFQPQVTNAPKVIDEVNRTCNEWAKEFGRENIAPEQTLMATQNQCWPQTNVVNVQPVPECVTYVREFFDAAEEPQQISHRPPPFLAICPPYNPPMEDSQMGAVGGQPVETMNSWLEEYKNYNEKHEKLAANYNEQFWDRLRDEWQKMSDEDISQQHPWLSDYSDVDPYKEYNFLEENPMADVENAFERGKEFLLKHDIPSAVLCFEVAAKKNPENAEIWEYLGISQAENEMDPQCIAALRRSLELQPNNLPVLMALAVSYTNESLQSQALKSLITWLHSNAKYTHLVPEDLLTFDDSANLASSLIRGPELREVQNLYLEAVKLNPHEVDPQVQEALGVLFNLSSEFDKAVDCFRAAVQVQPNNAKLWNRLGASLANGNRSVEAVEAYQRALEIEPGFIRVRYNVGVCCINLKAYKEAAEHLLIGLNIQATSSLRTGFSEKDVSNGNASQMSDTIWSTLKMIIALMGRNDLLEFVNQKNLNALDEAFKNM